MICKHRICIDLDSSAGLQGVLFGKYVGCWGLQYISCNNKLSHFGVRFENVVMNISSGFYSSTHSAISLHENVRIHNTVRSQCTPCVVYFVRTVKKIRMGKTMKKVVHRKWRRMLLHELISHTVISSAIWFNHRDINRVWEQRQCTHKQTDTRTHITFACILNSQWNMEHEKDMQ